MMRRKFQVKRKKIVFFLYFIVLFPHLIGNISNVFIKSYYLLTINCSVNTSAGGTRTFDFTKLF